MANENIWPRVDQFMPEEELTAAAERIRAAVDWAKLPKLAAIFEHRPPVNRYWHELVALTLLSLEANAGAMAERASPPVTESLERWAIRVLDAYAAANGALWSSCQDKSDKCACYVGMTRATDGHETPDLARISAARALASERPDDYPAEPK